MSISVFDITIALLVQTTAPLDVISEIMETIPTKQAPTFNSDGKVIGEKCNTWVFHTQYKNQTDLDMCLCNFLSRIPDISQKILLAKQYGKCALRLSIVSIYGQFGFELKPSDLQILTPLDIPLEISVFSYGNVPD